ncbi:MAG TPA: MXAN_5187 C-terminal domain-containing protein [Anaeromyxobacter sp.]|nr:MXAN_5187 C-terminal domain-containing protein [Anaeromyxobacter sp.]
MPPPQKPPARPGAPPAPGAPDAIREKDELVEQAQALEEEVEALKARYDQYFLGVERREPNRWRDEVKRKVMRLKSAFTRNTGLKFKIQSLHARYLSYERLWLRSAREREEGTYHRDLFKARLRARPEEKEKKEEAAPSAAAAGAASATGKAPGAAARPAASPRPPGPAAAPAAGGVGEVRMRALYDAYIEAKRRCNEDVSKLTYDAVAKSVAKQVPELMTRYKAKSVDFKVEVKDGRAVLKAIPKV